MLAAGAAPAIVKAANIMPLWVPRNPQEIIVAAGRGSILTVEMITAEALRVLENNLTFRRGVMSYYDPLPSLNGTIRIWKSS